MYTESALAGGLILWRSSGSLGATIPADGCVDVILRGDEVFVSGPSTTHIETLADDAGGSLGLRLLPGTAHGVLGLDLHEISDQVVALAEVVGRDATRHTRAALMRARDSGPSGPDLATALAPDLSLDSRWIPLVRRHAIRATPPGEVATQLGWSERTFRRRLLAHFGYPYLTLVRINRASRAQQLLATGVSPIEAAGAAGYADQAHLSREFRRLVGATPGQFWSSSAKRSIELPSGSSSVA
ncbi:helix-turn-helix transcriptional regulator [Leucobacter salsicius]|uniref:helix-turn-helix transcriptional regulator n=1 Tax=Leucobacter salsicius TaxID=664638 RepID=UPI00036BB4D5|nr:helix-turn-helix transcriptional regulator [Leucobacter salsicius]